MSAAGPPVVRAAGGLVWRHRDGRLELAVIHRPAPRNDWTFPKGKLEPGERHRDAARREVLEETGLWCRLGPKLGDVRYTTARGEDKRVRWWAMTVIEDRGFTPGREVDDLRWVPVEDCGSVLTYSNDRCLVHALFTSGALEDR